MKRAVRIVVGFLSLSLVVFAQTPQVPRLIRFSGIVKDATGKPMTGVLGITFSLYKDQQGGVPLWVETQNVQPDPSGHYMVLLGSAKSLGVPAEVFSSGEAQWLGVQAQGEAEQARVLMVSVPYALKALDAETVGGKPASAFAPANPPVLTSASNSARVPAMQSASGAALPPIGGSGQPGFIPEWTTTIKLGDSALFQSNSGNLGISTVTPAQKFEVDLGNMLMRGSDNFAKGGDTAFLYLGDMNHPIEAIHSNSNTNSGGLTLGTYKAPQVIYLQDGTGNVGIGIGTKSPTAALDVEGTVNTSASFNLGGKAFAFGSYANENAFLGFAGNSTTTGSENTASGARALYYNTTGADNTASGISALNSNTIGSGNTASGASALAVNSTGNHNTAIGEDALLYNSTGNYNTAIGENTLVLNQTGSYNTALGNAAYVGSVNLNNATAIGANAEVTQSNTLVLGCVVGVNNCQGAVSVAIGTTAPDNMLTVNGSADKPGGGSWGTYSDRRLKTLDGSFNSGLSQIMRLHPVRYRYNKENALGIQDTQEHVGLVAQDVQAVIPEAVAENSKGYLLLNNDPIIWSMLNAIKEQQKEIRDLKSELRANRQTLQKVKAQVAAVQPALVAGK